MRSKNTMKKSEYIWDNLYWTTLVFFSYRNLCFCPVFRLNYTLSTILFAATLVAGTTAGVLLTYKHRRNYTNLFCNIALSLAPYHIISYWNITPTALTVTGCVTAAAICAYTLLILRNYRRRKQNSHAGTAGRQWLRFWFFNSRVLICAALALLMLCTGLKPLIGLPVLEFQPNASSTGFSDADSEGETIEKNMDVILLLQDEYWSKLDANARLKVLKTIADIEANYLGIEKLTVCAAPLDEILMGHYDDTTRTVTLNLYYLSTEDGRTMLSTLCHECYHAYQHRLVDLYNQADPDVKGLLLLRDIPRYQNEFSNYIDGTGDYEGYSSQSCELDSDSYASSAVVTYLYCIQQYNQEQNGGQTE